MLSATDERLLAFFFNSDHLFWGSPFGGQLERARAASRDSNNRAHPAARPWNWLPPRWCTPPGYPMDQPDQEITVGNGRGNEHAGYEVDEAKLANVGLVSSRLLRLYRKDPRAFGVLAAYYGDRGARWAAAAVSRSETLDGRSTLDIRPRRVSTKDIPAAWCSTSAGAPAGDYDDPHEDIPTRVCYRGRGPGAIAALIPFTPAGRRLLDAAKHPHAPTVRSAARAAADEHEVRRSELLAAIARQEEVVSTVAHHLEVARDQLAAETQQAVTLAEEEGRRLTRRALLRHTAQAAGRAAELDTRLGEEQRIIVLLRRAHAHSAAPTTLANPAPDPSTAAALEDLAAHAAGRLATPPQMPPARLPAHGHRGTTDLTDDEQLDVFYVIASRPRTERGDPRLAREAENRRLTLARAERQAEEMLAEARDAWLASRGHRDVKPDNVRLPREEAA